MASEDTGVDGPRLVWTFPLITRVQQGSRFLDLGSNMSSMMESDGVGSRVRERIGDDEDLDVSSEDDIDEVESQIDSIKDNSESAFELESDDVSEPTVTEVEIHEGTFIPMRANIDPGDTVEWVNEDDKVHKITTVKGTEFTSEQIESGESYEYTFDEEDTVVYIDPLEGGGNMSGAVVVGESDKPETLPSENDDPDLELFTDESDSGEDDTSDSRASTRSMSAAAEEKDQLDVGFSD